MAIVADDRCRSLDAELGLSQAAHAISTGTAQAGEAWQTACAGQAAPQVGSPDQGFQVILCPYDPLLPFMTLYSLYVLAPLLHDYCPALRCTARDRGNWFTCRKPRAVAAAREPEHPHQRYRNRP